MKTMWKRGEENGFLSAFSFNFFFSKLFFILSLYWGGSRNICIKVNNYFFFTRNNLFFIFKYGNNVVHPVFFLLIFFYLI